MKAPATILLLLLAALVTATAAQEKIAFASNRDGNNEIYIMDSNGSRVDRLTNNSTSDSDPSLSPDGTKIAFVSVRDGDEEIYVMNSDGTNQTRLTFSPEEDDSPSFGPGGKIAFMTSRHVTKEDNNQEIYVINDDGSSQTRLTNNLSIDTWPSISGDGSTIVFVSNRDGNLEIYKMNSNGGGQTRLTSNNYSDGYPAIDRTGNRIVFASQPVCCNLDIYIMNSDGTGLVQLTNSLALDYQPAFSPDSSKIAFTTQRDGNYELYVMNSDGTDQIRRTNNMTVDQSPSWGGFRRPVLIVPGIAGTYAADAGNDMNWLLNRGAQPESLQIDPLARVYHDLIKTFENVGYVKDKDLFVVNYDWRLLPGPSDNNMDGIVSNIDASSITDTNFKYGVDYLGLALKKAYERWEQDHSGEPLTEVDIVAHSTGGLVSRTYIQSPAYNTAFSGKKKLPKVRNMIMVGVPNRGASKAWNALHDNWNADIAYKAVLSKIISRAYLKVLIGNTITGPDHSITLNSILDVEGHPDPIKFINLYVPTIRSLLATYDFLDLGTGYANVNSDPNYRNQWLLDLNSGYDLAPSGDRNGFAGKCKATIIYASGHETLTFTKQILTGGEDVLFNFSDIQAGDVPVDTPWFMDIPSLSGGDGTVPVISSTGQFVGDDRVTLKQIIAGNPDHTGLMSNLDAQIQILETIDTPFEIDDISMEFAGNQYLTILGIVSDPVDSFLIDGKGRRLGYSEATGVVNEIPGGVWFGDADGAGWIFGDIERPLRVELTGRGEPFYYIASADSPDADGGVVSSGFLGKGEKKNLEVTIGTTSLSGRITDSRGRGIQGAMVTLTDALGIQRRAATSSFGYYIFPQVPADVTYQIGVRSKRFSFIPASRSVFAENDIGGIDFISIE